MIGWRRGANPAERAGVIATGYRFEFGDDLHRAHFRGARDGTPGEERADDVGGAGGSLQLAFDL